MLAMNLVVNIVVVLGALFGDAATTGAVQEPAVGKALPDGLVAVEADVARCATAAEAVLVYRLFIADPSLPADLKIVADRRLAELGGLAAQGQARVGDGWGTPAEAAEAASEAQDEVEHAIELMRVGNGMLAKESLDKAIKLDPRNSRAPFATGLTYLMLNNRAKAEAAFAAAADMEVENGPALNNLAVCELLLRRPVEAAEHLRRAAELVRDLQPICDNVALAIRLAATPGGRMPPKPLEQFNALLRWLGRDLGIKPSETVTSYTFLAWDGRPCSDERGTVAGYAPQDRPRAAAGIVVAPGHVLVPAGLVRSGWDLAVANRDDASQPLPARIVAVFDRLNVALLHCEGLQASPFPLAERSPAVGEEVRAVSTPGSAAADRWGVGRGPVLSAPEGGLFMHGAPVARGLGGGAVIDQSGRVVGMVAALPRTDSIGLARGFAIPIDDLWPLLKEHLPDLEAAEPASPGNGEGSTRNAKESTVSVLQIKPEPQP